MNNTAKKMHELNSSNLKGYWNFESIENGIVKDLSGNENDLKAVGNLKCEKDKKFPGFVTLNGKDQYLSSDRPIIRTDQSFSVAAWVRLNSSSNFDEILKEDDHALTAVSQNSSTHSVFYLGVRRIQKEDQGIYSSSLKWSFTISPIDGTESGEFDWTRANSTTVVDKTFFDKWVFLVGVVDANNKTASIYVPSLNETDIIKIPDGWDLWKANESLQVGRSRWLETDLDYWPGSIGPVRIYSSALTKETAQKLYDIDQQDFYKD